MKGVLVEKPGAPFTVVNDLEKPKPSPSEVLVKSIVTAINPVDMYMQAYGMLVQSFPIVLGCDAAGVVVEVGSEASSKFKKGDEVCGCTRLGQPGNCTFQEYFVMEADLTMPKPKNLSLEQAATLGVGSLTAGLGLFSKGSGIPYLDPKNLPSSKDEWILILGGAGSVGQYAVQFAKAAGYKVLASCSSKSAGSIQKLGADACVDYKKSEDEQLKEITSMTGGNFSLIYDTVAKSAAFAKRALNEVSKSGQKCFATTDDWTDIGSFEGIELVRVQLGLIGKTGDDIKSSPNVNKDIARLIPMIVGLVEAGKVVPNEHEVFGEGFESISDAIAQHQKSGGSGAKLVVKLQSP